MTAMMDRFWIARGLDEAEIMALGWRRTAYGVLCGLAVLNGGLALAAFANYAA